MVRSDNIQLSQQVLLAQLTLALGSVDPNGTGQVLANEMELRPVFPAFGVL